MKISQDLDSNWQLFHHRENEWLEAQVPGCVHTDLQRHGRIPDPFWSDNESGLRWMEEEDWTYRATFTPAAEIYGLDHLELVAEGLDTLASVKFNGVEVGRTESMFIGYRWQVAHLLREGENELEIRFASNMPYIRERKEWQPYPEANDPVGGSSRIRKMQCQFGWDWGPRLVTAGVWRPLRLEGWQHARLGTLKIAQRHARAGVEVEVIAQILGEGEVTLAAELSLAGEAVATGEGTQGRCTLQINQPQLWWPAGQGEQPLYDLKVSLRDSAGQLLDATTRRLGLREIELVRERNLKEVGESFFLRVNGRAVFAKGGNWIPAHSFVAGLTRADYEPGLRSMVEANMNTVRLWGGGIYEHEAFYDLCDELGLLIWHDFMFACSLYPGEPEFLDLVREEARQQVSRIHHHAALALWCGNNEIPYMPGAVEGWKKEPHRRGHYAEVFHRILPDAVAERDGTTPYWPSSPWSPPETGLSVHDGAAGDVHFWGVWHSRQPVSAYEELRVRFCSEFGMQSYASPETTATFCPPDQQNVFSPAMECHQKNGGGNATILHYLSQRYRFPRDFAALSYLSQLNQAYCMKVGVEHLRWCQPYTMGALYWQINDCWPVASWSSIEFGGRWKALHHEARRFFAPALAYLRMQGEVRISQHNLLINTQERADLYAVYDGPVAGPARLQWSLRHLDGTPAGEEGALDVLLEPLTSTKHAEVPLAEVIAQTGGQAYLQVDLLESAAPGARALSRQTRVLTLPRYLDLPDPEIEVHSVEAPGAVPTIRLLAKKLALSVMLWLPDHPQAQFSDNYFDLRPGEPWEVAVRTDPALSVEEVVAHLQVMHLRDSYLD